MEVMEKERVVINASGVVTINRTRVSETVASSRDRSPPIFTRSGRDAILRDEGSKNPVALDQRIPIWRRLKMNLDREVREERAANLLPTGDTDSEDGQPDAEPSGVNPDDDDL